MKPLISIILPIYNVKDYLPKCMKSIFAQTYTNLEIIMVDDGSTDGSGKLCDDYAAKDSRVRVFHKKTEDYQTHVIMVLNVQKVNSLLVLILMIMLIKIMLLIFIILL